MLVEQWIVRKQTVNNSQGVKLKKKEIINNWMNNKNV